MTNLTTKLDSAGTVPIISFTQANPVTSPSSANSAVTTVALSTLAKTPPQTTKSFSQTLVSDTFLQSNSKTVSEIDNLVEIGKTNGTPTISKDQIKTFIKEKISSLQEHAKDQYNLPSVRSDLCKLSKISTTYYPDLKEEVLNLLILLIENDPIEPSTAGGILEIVIDLNSELVLVKAQLLTIPLQRKFARAFSAAVELYLRHYKAKDHVNAVIEDQKKVLLDTQSSFSGLNTKENVGIEFASQMATEASKRLTSDNSLFMEILGRLAHGAKALNSAYQKDIVNFFTELVQVFQGLENKIQEEWFEALFILRDLVKNSPDPLKKILIIHTILTTKGINYDWKYIYGCLEILGDVILQIQDPKLLYEILFGKNTPIKTATASMALSIAATNMTEFPGVVSFVDFKEYVKKAFVASEKDKKADSAIQTKARELCTLLKQKLAATYEGRKLMSDKYNTGEASQNEILKDVFPTDSKRYSEWLGTPTIVKPKEPVIRDSKEDGEKKKLNDLTQAITKGLKESVQNLVKDKSLLKLKDEKGNNPLIIAARTGQLEICKIFIALGLSPITRGENFRNALHNAAMIGYVEIVKLFAKDKVLLKAEDEHRKTALILGIEHGQEEVCRILVEAEVDQKLSSSKAVKSIDIQDKDGNSALILAAKKNMHPLCELLLKSGANPVLTDLMHRNALHWAIQSGNISIVQLLSKHEVLINAKSKQGSTPLIMAASLGHSEICEILLSEEVNPAEKDENGMNALHHAAMAGNADSVRLFLKYTELVNSKDVEDNTPLTLAAKAKGREIFEILLKENADPLATNKHGWNAMHFAADSGATEIVQRLSSNKQLVDSKNKKEQTALLLSAMKGNQEACSILLKAGANPSAKDVDGWNAMHHAVFSGNVETVKLFTSNKALIDLENVDNCKTPLMIAAELGHTEICDLLLKTGADPLIRDRASNWNALYFAIAARKLEVVRLLSTIQQLINEEEYYTPLLLAIRNGFHEACEILLKAGADPRISTPNGLNANVLNFVINSDKIEIIQLFLPNKSLINTKTDCSGGMTPLMYAAQKGNKEVCAFLIKSEANPLALNDNKRTAMHLAAWNGRTEVVQMLLVNPSLIDAKDEREITPIMLSANPEIFEMLQKAGANILATDANEENVLHHAVESNHIKVVELLSTQKKLIDARNKYSKTPLMFCVGDSYNEIFEILLKAGADPLPTDDEGRNAMHRAVELHSKKMVEQLLANKKLIDSKNKLGKTPLILSAVIEISEIFETLLKAGADPLLADNEGWNAMHYAAGHNKTEIIRLLSSYKQLIHSQNKGITPLKQAARFGHQKACEILLEIGADPLEKDICGYNAMHYAAEIGRTEVVQLFSTNKNLIDSIDIDGMTPLMWAAFKGTAATCEALLKAGADVQLKDKSEQNTLHYAVKGGKIEIVQLFLNHKELIDAKDAHETTPIMLAVNPEIFEMLQKAGANPLATDAKGENSMHRAVKLGSKKIVEQLLSNKQLIDSRNKEGKTPLILCAEKGYLEICEALLKAGADSAAINDGSNAMHEAAFYNHPEVIRLLATNKQLINSKTKIKLRTPLILTALRGNKESCAVLLELGADPMETDHEGWNAMHYAAEEGKTEVVRLLSTNKSIIDSRGGMDDETPFMLAAKYNRKESCEILLKADANVQLKNKKGKTQLMLCAEWGRLEICEALLKAGADSAAIDSEGLNALHQAAGKGKIEIVKLFLDKKELINAKDKVGKTPLLTASQFGYREVCEILLKAGADVLETDNNLYGVLHYAAVCNKTEIVHLFSTNKLLVDTKNKFGETPLIVSAIQGNRDVCDILLKAGADLNITKDGKTAMQFAKEAQKNDVVELFATYLKEKSSKK